MLETFQDISQQDMELWKEMLEYKAGEVELQEHDKHDVVSYHIKNRPALEKNIKVQANKRRMPKIVLKSAK